MIPFLSFELGANGMETLKGVPLRNQGEALPTDFTYEGQWIHKPRMFLYRPSAQRSLVGAEMTPVVNDAFGINSMHLAFELGLNSEEIFEHNRAHTLYLVTADDVPPTMGAAFAKRYVFQIGDRQAVITTEWGGPSGNA